MLIRIRTLLKNLPQDDRAFTFPVRVGDIPKNIPTGVNPRTPNARSKPYRDMYAALTEVRTGGRAPFYDANGGMHTAASSIRFEKSDGVVTAVVSFDPEENGLYNGGHTYLAIKNASQNDGFQADEAVKFSVATGLSREQILSMVESHNNTRQVKGYSLAYLRGEFDWLEGILESRGVRQNFRFQEGEEGTTSVLDAVRLLVVANPRFYPTDVKRSELTHGHSYYSSINRALNTLQSERGGDARAMAPLLDFVFNLSTKVLREASRLHRVPRARLYMSGGRSGGRSSKAVPFTKSEAELEHYLHSGILLPLVAPVRMFINDDMTLKISQADIMLIFMKALPDLLDRAAKMVHQFDGVDSAGASEPIWSKLYEIVEEYAATRLERAAEG